MDMPILLGELQMSQINLLIKPASSNCNMRCKYCFYKDEAEHRTQASMGTMKINTAEKLIEQAFDAAGKQGSVSIIFQGGEPTLAGIEFFEQFVKVAGEKNIYHQTVSYAIQTNGYAVDTKWTEFFSKNHFLVGISVDGDKTLHDEFRVDVAGKGTWNRIQKNIHQLQAAGVECNLLCVVTKRCAKSAVKTYHALKKTGIKFLQFIPCLDPIGEERGQLPWSLTPDDYGNFLCTLFDEWYRDWQQGNYTSIRLFDDYVHLAMGVPPSTCATSGRCGAYYVVEANGSVYPCDFYVLDQWKLGDIHQTPLKDLGQSNLAARFLCEGLKKPIECENCRWKYLCFGGCKRDYYLTENEDIRNYYCEAFKHFFGYAESRIKIIAYKEMTMAQGFHT